MLLTIDVGNSQTNFGVFDQSTLLAQFSEKTDASKTGDSHASFLLPLFKHHNFVSPWKEVLLCSVVPSANSALEQFAATYLNTPAKRLRTLPQNRFDLAVPDPQSVGEDRLANTMYAVQHLKLPALVVDFGTATTIDVISDRKTYEGGAIIPGVRLCLEALAGGTAQLPSVELKLPKNIIGKTTTECIQSGTLNGYCAMMSGLLNKFTASISGECSIVSTGGYGKFFENQIPEIDQWIPHLTLEGIRLFSTVGDSSSEN